MQANFCKRKLHMGSISQLNSGSGLLGLYNSAKVSQSSFVYFFSEITVAFTLFLAAFFFNKQVAWMQSSCKYMWSIFLADNYQKQRILKVKTSMSTSL